MSTALGFEVVSITEVPVDDAAENVADRPLILVVDDEPLVADTLALILTRAGYHAVRAYDGRSALEIAGTKKPDLLITDVAMPEMNGVELAVAMVSAVPDCQVVLFSGHARGADIVRAHKVGHEFPLMRKPMPPAEMLKQVARSLSRVAG